MPKLVWTPARIQRFTQHWQDFAPIHLIGEEFGLSELSVCQQASRLSLPPRRYVPSTTFAEFDVRLRNLGGYRDITRAEAAALGPLPLSAPLPPRPSTYTPRSC